MSLSYANGEYGLPNGEEGVSLDCRQPRYDIKGHLDLDSKYFECTDLSWSQAAYRHAEIENGAAGTRFKLNGSELRLDILQKQLGRWRGRAGYTLNLADFSALGEEAIQPPTESAYHGIYLTESVQLDELDHWQLELGARTDLRSLEASRASNKTERNFTGVSGAAGLRYRPSLVSELALTVSTTSRAPSGFELFSDGPHLATADLSAGMISYVRNVG